VINAATLFNAGFTDLVCVIPPGAQLNPSSTILPNQLGKVPGILRADGTWTGYNWQTSETSLQDCVRWMQQGANVGLRTARFPAVDIDVLDETLSSRIEQLAREVLGPAPTRVGLAPKRLMLYRTDAPFSRMRMRISDGHTDALIEVLGRGQQFVAAGTHPSGLTYSWSRSTLSVDELPVISLKECETFFDRVGEMLSELGGYTFTIEGGKTGVASDVDQSRLRAPSFDALASLVQALPNSHETFAGYDEYIHVGYAIKAACGPEHEHEGLQLFAEWAARWQHPTKQGSADAAAGDWKRLHPPFRVGWPFLVETAMRVGGDAATTMFGVLRADVPSEVARDLEEPLYGTEHWLAWRALHLIGHKLRFVPLQGRWYVWDGLRWVPDSVRLAEAEVHGVLISESKRIMAAAKTDEDRAAATKMARTFLTAQRASNVRKILESDRNIALSASSLDTDSWIVNTPAGIINLRSGTVSPNDAGSLCSKITATGPSSEPPLKWIKFLHEACDGDTEMAAYLQKVAGYCLTGVTTEQTMWFVWGPGGNGKSLFLSTLQGILGDYAATASMDTLTATQSERHSTDIAALSGARFVAMSETASGKRWDEQRLTSLTGGEMVTARFMRQDNFTFMPQFKLIVAGNHAPGVRDVTDALRRRMRLVPFITKPAVPNQNLFEELREEWPQILGWMVEGCLKWQAEGMQTPAAVKAETAVYFEEEDTLQQFLNETCVIDPNATALTAELFGAWREWSNANNAWTGDSKRLSTALHSRGFERWRDPKTGKRGYKGLGVKNTFETLT
jgi:putative DNA primase/helicase